MAESANVKVVIGIPLSWGHIPWKFFRSYIEMLKPPETVVLRASSYSVADMRNMCAAWAVEANASHLLMLDVDMIYPPDSLVKLLEADRDIIGGLAARRKPPHAPSYTVFGEDGALTIAAPPVGDDVIECATVGGCGMLVKTSVFKNVPKPWFTDTATTKKGGSLSEDNYFCLKAGAHGFQTFCHTGLVFPHEVDVCVSLTKTVTGQWQPKYAEAENYAR